MERGDLYLVSRPGNADPRKQRVFVVVSRKVLLQSNFATAICAPVFSKHHDLQSQVSIGVDEGLKHPSSIHCDELVSLPKSLLTRYVGPLSQAKMAELDRALAAALEILIAPTAKLI